jgi:hypothetical protein
MSENSDGRAALLVSAAMYTSTLSAGVLLVVLGRTPPLEASAFISPFLMAMPRANGAARARASTRKQPPQS